MAAIARAGAGIVRENPGHAPEFLPPEIAAQLVTKEPPGWNSTAAGISSAFCLTLTAKYEMLFDSP